MTTKRKRISEKRRKDMLKNLNFTNPAQDKSFNFVIDYINDFYQNIITTKEQKIDSKQTTIYDAITC